MLTVNSHVIYASVGACKITDIITRNFGAGNKQYYVLSPVFGNSSLFYVPTDNDAARSLMMPVLSRDQVEALINSMPSENPEWIADNRARNLTCSEILKSGDRTRLIRMIKAIYAKKTERSAAGKCLGTADEMALNKAENILYGEFALVLGIKPGEVVGYIEHRLAE